uniref:Major facilitator superfamily (MFS) profile domain-containing protein n=1 Tax=Entomoneis paludosa TaxID=265537 RepID=A0A7S2YK16_9STRA
MAWRVALSVPAVIAFGVACFFYHNSDDCPLGSYKEVRAAGLLQQKSAVDSFRQGIFNLNAWILFVQFGASLGIELVMESGMTMHLSERFGIPVARAAGLASLFGLMNIWARGFGGYISDRLHKMFSLRGRLFLQMALLLLEGLLILCFNQQGSSLNMTLFWMVSFAAAGQMGMGTCFGLIPYIDPRCTGTIAGIVAAGGNFGGVFLSNVFRTSASDAESFQVMANFCFVAALLTPLLVVSGYRGIVWGQEQTAAATLLTPAIASTRSS